MTREEADEESLGIEDDQGQESDDDEPVEAFQTKARGWTAVNSPSQSNTDCQSRRDEEWETDGEPINWKDEEMMTQPDGRDGQSEAEEDNEKGGHTGKAIAVGRIDKTDGSM